jgi:hypothetical protein
MSSAVLVQMNGCLRSFQPSMNCRILIMRSRTERKLPRWMAWRSMIPNQTSTRFSHDPEVGVKRTWILGSAASQLRISTRLFVGGVVVHHQVQLAVGAAAGHMLQERQELLTSVPVLREPGDVPGGDARASDNVGCHTGRSHGCAAQHDRAAVRRPSRQIDLLIKVSVMSRDPPAGRSH